MPSKEVVRARLQSLVHALTALVIFLKGLVKLEHPEGYWPLIVFLFAGSALILALTLLHHRLHLSDLAVNITTYLIEATALGAVGYLYISEGRRGIGTVTLISALGFLTACAVTWWKMGGPKPARH